MNFMYKLSSLLVIVLISCQTSVAQPTPVITKKYNDAQIDRMITEHRATDSRDVTPHNTLSQKLIKDFPKAKDIDWELGSAVYEAEFEIGRTDFKAYYDAQGDLLMYIVEIKESDLPAVVRNAAVGKYPDYKFDDVKKIVKGTKTNYQFELKHNRTEVQLLCNSNGQIISELFD